MKLHYWHRHPRVFEGDIHSIDGIKMAGLLQNQGLSVHQSNANYLINIGLKLVWSIDI